MSEPVKCPTCGTPCLVHLHGHPDVPDTYEPLPSQELERLRKVLADCHEAVGESPDSDDETLAEGIRLHISEARERLAWQDEELERLREALQKIRDEEGRVCSNYELCQHVGCQSSYSSWAIADKALREKP